MGTAMPANDEETVIPWAGAHVWRARIDGTTTTGPGVATAIEPGKVRAYLATAYRLGFGTGSPCLRVGEPVGTAPGTAAAWIDAHAPSGGAFITAWNPQGVDPGPVANAAAHARMLARLAAAIPQGASVIEGEGAGDAGDWPAERSAFAPGLPYAAAVAIGCEFGQNAIVWVGPDLVPVLVLLR